MSQSKTSGQNQNDWLQLRESELNYEAESYDEIHKEDEYFGESGYMLGIGPWTSECSEEVFLTEKPLSSLESAAMACLFEDAVDELIILKYIIGVPLVEWDLRYRTVQERYTRRLTPERIFPEINGVPILTSAIKLQRDREAIESVFNKMIKTLEETGRYPSLSLSVTALQDEEEEDEVLIKELQSNLVYLKILRLRVEEKRRADELDEIERDELIYQLQDEIDDVMLKCKVEEKFVDKWENVRNAQNDLKLQAEEKKLTDQIEHYNIKMKAEKRITHEFQVYLKNCQADLEEQLEDWMTDYDSEMERRENKIIQLKYNRDQAEENKIKTHRLFEERKEEMKEWVAFRDLRQLRTGASLTIQSWWRGMMVRKRLGPYKPKKEKGKKGQKKNK